MEIYHERERELLREAGQRRLAKELRRGPRVRRRGFLSARPAGW